MTAMKQIEGWGWPYEAALSHYFRAGRSLCGRWGLGGGMQKEQFFPPDSNCGRCSRILKMEMVRAQSQEGRKA